MAKSRANKKATEKVVPVAWVGLADMPVRTADTVISSFTPDLFVVGFGFTNRPTLLGTPGEVAKQMEAITHVTVTPVVRLALTEGQMERTIEVLKENLSRFRQQKKGDK